MKRYYPQCAGLAAAVLLVISNSVSIAMSGEVQPKTIYGEDERYDLYQIQDSKLLELARSTVALFQHEDIQVDPMTSSVNLLTAGYDQNYTYPLCREERFFGQQYGAYCSGTLVGEDLILTAGHCIETLADCKATAFVFGFAIRQPGAAPSSVPAFDTYGCKEIVGRKLDDEGADFAVIRLDRKVTDRKPIPVSRRKYPKPGEGLFAIGHPSGLPTKIALGGYVLDIPHEEYFTAVIDTFGGNSGSAIFNARTGRIEGVLVRGNTDFDLKPGHSCYVSYRCTEEECLGEDVTLASAFAKYVPRTRRSRKKPEP